MRANELMIGDWVALYGTPTRWELTDYEKWHKEMERTDVRTFEPIPLTAEIVEKNGFKPQFKIGKICHYYVYKDGNDILTVGLFDRTTEFDYVNMIYNPEDVSEENYRQTLEFMRIINVHEAQHALRLCGLTELAHNFIV